MALTADAGAHRVADGARVEATIDALARRLHADNDQEVALVGIRRRGVPLANMLAENLRRFGRHPALGEIQLSRYADDLRLLHEQPRSGTVDLPFDLAQGNIVLVDDVLYTGRTLFRAVDLLIEAGARNVACAVLCARGPTEVPVQVAHIGLRFDVGPEQIIEVRIPPYETDLEVVLRYRPTRPSSV